MARTIRKPVESEPAEGGPIGPGITPFEMSEESNLGVFAPAEPPDESLPVVVTVPAAQVRPYTRQNWKADVYVYMCSKCGHCENLEDNMILHVLTHVPENEREALLNQLTMSPLGKEN